MAQYKLSDIVNMLLTSPTDMNRIVLSKITNADKLKELWYWTSSRIRPRSPINTPLSSSLEKYPLRSLLISSVEVIDEGDVEVDWLLNFFNIKQCRVILRIENIAQVLAVANLPYLSYVRLDFTNELFAGSDDIFNEQKIFFSQYLEGKIYSYNERDHQLEITQNDRTINNGYFQIEYSDDGIVIDNGTITDIWSADSQFALVGSLKIYKDLNNPITNLRLTIMDLPDFISNPYRHRRDPLLDALKIGWLGYSSREITEMEVERVRNEDEEDLLPDLLTVFKLLDTITHYHYWRSDNGKFYLFNHLFYNIESCFAKMEASQSKNIISIRFPLMIKGERFNNEQEWEEWADEEEYSSLSSSPLNLLEDLQYLFDIKFPNLQEMGFCFPKGTSVEEILDTFNMIPDLYLNRLSFFVEEEDIPTIPSSVKQRFEIIPYTQIGSLKRVIRKGEENR